MQEHIHGPWVLKNISVRRLAASVSKEKSKIPMESITEKQLSSDCEESREAVSDSPRKWRARSTWTAGWAKSEASVVEREKGDQALTTDR